WCVDGGPAEGGAGRAGADRGGTDVEVTSAVGWTEGRSTLRPSSFQQAGEPLLHLGVRDGRSTGFTGRAQQLRPHVRSVRQHRHALRDEAPDAVRRPGKLHVYDGELAFGRIPP